MVQTHILDELELERGGVLHEAPVAFRTWGRLNARADNAVVVCHALTGDTDALDWWHGLVGPGQVVDTERYFVVCLNVLGSPYGSASPLTPDPQTGRPYGPDFPDVTIRDTVEAHRRVLEALGVRRVAFAVGGSMGGMQVLEWGFHGDLVGALVPLAVGAWHSAWCIGISEAQRQAIFADPHWNRGRYAADQAPVAGLATARMMAMISYRARGSFEARFGRTRMEGVAHPGEGEPPFAVESYLRYQGQKLVERFDANCYVALTRQMDSHDVARGRAASPAEALSRIGQPAFVLGIDSDVLYPLEEQRFLAQHLPKGDVFVLSSPHGHDAFLIEFERLDALLRPWIESNVRPPALAAADACT